MSSKYDTSLMMFDLALEPVRPESPDDTKRRLELAALKAEAHEARREADWQRRRAATHIGKLPVEIFLEIFPEVISADCASILHISHVCRHWRDVLGNTPQLWTTLVLTGKKPARKAKLWMNRSHGKIRELCIRATAADNTDWIHLVHWNRLRIVRVVD